MKCVTCLLAKFKKEIVEPKDAIVVLYGNSYCKEHTEIKLKKIES